MDNSRALPSADAREILAMREQGVDQGVLLVARAGMHDQPGRLIQHEQIVVLEQNLERHLPLAGLRFFQPVARSAR